MNDLPRGRRNQVFRTIMILSIGCISLFLLDSVNFLLAHTFAEMFSISVAMVIFFIAWNSREYTDNSYFAYIGIGYLFVAVIDMLHTLAYKGMGVFPGFSADLPTQMWILGRYMESLTLYIALFFIRRRISATSVLLLMALITAAGIGSIFSGFFPSCYIEGVGLTSFKKISELVIVFILLLAFGRLIRERHYFSPTVFNYLSASLILTMFAEMAFIMYVGVYDLSNLLGHYFKIVSFYFIYRGVIVTGFKDPYSFLLQELKQNRDEIAYTQGITSTMLNNIPEEVVLLEKSTCRIIDANRTFLEEHGISKEDALNRTCFDIIHDQVEPCWKRHIDCPLRTDDSGKSPKVHMHYDKQGEQRYVEVSVWPVDPVREQGAEVVYIGRDITEQKRMEQMRDDVERVVRHDLKSPLNGIIGGSALLLQDTNLTENQMRMLEAIGESGRSVLNMIDHSLKLYRMEAGIYSLRREAFDFVSVLLQLNDRMKIADKGRHIRLDCKVNGENLEDSSPLIIHAEKASMETVLSNLVENAVEASHPGETVTIRADEDGSGILKLDIHNQGAIPPQIRERFFERYVTFGKNHGNGLGTYSVYLITQAHGGTVSFTTDEKTGTHIRVEIPVL